MSKNTLESMLSRHYRISAFAAGMLTGLVRCPRGVDVDRFDLDGREALLWLLHRGLVQTEDHLNVLSAKLSYSGAMAIRLSRKLLENELAKDQKANDSVTKATRD